MMLVERPGYRIDNRTINRGSRASILIVSRRRELKPLHPWHHIYCFLFGSYLCEWLVLLMLVMTSPSSSKTTWAASDACCRVLTTAHANRYTSSTTMLSYKVECGAHPSDNEAEINPTFFR